MVNKKETQTTLLDYETKQIGINTESYAILRAIKNQLIKKHKKNFTFSDAIIELKRKSNGTKIDFSKEEINQIKTTLKGGLK